MIQNQTESSCHVLGHSATISFFSPMHYFPYDTSSFSWIALHGLNIHISVHVFSSDFEELEAVPNLAVMDGPLEPPTSSATSIPDVHVPDDSFVNFFSVSTFVNSRYGSLFPLWPFLNIK